MSTIDCIAIAAAAAAVHAWPETLFFILFSPSTPHRQTDRQTEKERVTRDHTHTKAKSTLTHAHKGLGFGLGVLGFKDG